MNGADNKPRLTDQQKKQNHIVSEQKRREAIRRGFDRLSQIVPGMEGQGRSEALVLAATVEYLKQQVAKKEELKAKAKERGMSEREFERAYQGAVKELETAEKDDGEGGREVKVEGGSSRRGHGGSGGR
ncbi:hypothetical protein LTR36_004689 [Oleoguttula mirabilis]|uniref:BHLH domain-containing protein n=1 Tax=Oleoguttula mirabilis TaxID=1507867 RepID=A0AAV9JFD3_9PEZI|nr:hypothetical protein LTR36_004689 [Oleoguttula mirabilis]